MDIAAWLRDLGLERYEQAFSDNDIDDQVLAKLTSEDLKELGIASVGHRRKLLEAIEGLCRTEDVGRPAVNASSSAEEMAPRSPAERRQLTVMFVDLVGSTALSSLLDPEDMGEVLRLYQNTVTGEITRLEGHVAKLMGDGVLAYFGWPRAHEDEAERAVRAGLGIVDAISRLEGAGASLACRIGIATGLVVVGDLVGEGSAREETVVGETPNVAARLQELAGPGKVVVSEVTASLIGGAFALDDMGLQQLKGLSKLQRAFQVTAERVALSRFETRSGTSLLPMVGRDQELALLLERWAQAKTGEGQAVMLIGEAGIGKSRIVQALLEAVTVEPHYRIRYQCSPHHEGSVLWPVIQQLRHAADIEPGDPDEIALDKLEVLLARGADDGSARPLIAELLGLSFETRYGSLDLVPQVKRTRTIETLIGQLLGLASSKPVLMILEDAHWIDPSTLELIEQSLGSIPDSRVLMILTSRRDGQPKFSAPVDLTQLQLGRIGTKSAEEISTRLGGDRLPPGMVGEIIARCDGIPLFVEELTKAVVESGETHLPASLYDTLMARLDRVPEAKKVAQIAACIGRDFSFELLAAVSEFPTGQLTEALDLLATAGLVQRRDSTPSTLFRFKHALVRDAAYASMLNSRRRALHAQIARVLGVSFVEIAETQPELLAHHYTAAGLPDRAIDYWRRAGVRAMERSANIEAINHLEKGLSLLAELPDEAERNWRELALQLDLGPAFMAIKGQAANQVRAAYARARQLGPKVGDARQHFRALWGAWRNHVMRSECEQAHEVGQECLSLAECSHDVSFLLAGRFATGGSLCFKGEFRAAREQLEQAIPLYEFDKHRALCYQYGQDPGASSMGYLGWVLWFLGLPEQAIAIGRDALALAEKLEHPFTLAQISMYHAMVFAFCRKWDEARALTERTIVLSKDQGFPQTLWLCSSMHARALAETEEPSVAAALLQEAVFARKAMGHSAGRLFELALLAEAYGAADRNEDALRAVAEGLSFAKRTGERLLLPELQRQKGELLLRSNPSDTDRAEAFLRSALKTARRQEAKLLELRSAVSLARLWVERGQLRQAQDLLHPIYDPFTEGFEMPDLIEAKQLLDFA